MGTGRTGGRTAVAALLALVVAGCTYLGSSSPLPVLDHLAVPVRVTRAPQTQPTPPYPSASASKPASASPTDPVATVRVATAPPSVLPTSTAAPTSTPESTAPPTAPADSPNITVVHQITGTSVWLNDAIGTEEGFVAVGSEFDPEEPSEPGDFHRGTILTSRDGVDWSHITPDALDGAVLRKVVEYEGALYAFGSFCPPDRGCDSRPQRAGWTVWKSVDWSTWEQLPQSPALQSQVIADVVIAGGEMVALGQLVPDEPVPSEWPAVTWRSTDGVAWKASQSIDIEELPQFARAASDGSTIVAFTGEAFAVGSIWYSTDLGKKWTNVPLTHGDSCRIRDIGVAGERFVVVGSTDPAINTPYPCSWTSTDGISWTGGAVLDHAGIRFSEVVGVGGLAVAVGAICECDPWTGGPAVVLVGDGVTWERIGSVSAYSGGITPQLAAGNDAGVVVLGVGIVHPGDSVLQFNISHIPADALLE